MGSIPTFPISSPIFFAFFFDQSSEDLENLSFHFLFAPRDSRTLRWCAGHIGTNVEIFGVSATVESSPTPCISTPSCLTSHLTVIFSPQTFFWRCKPIETSPNAFLTVASSGDEDPAFELEEMPVEADAVHEPLISDDQRPTRISQEVDGYGSDHEGTQPAEEAEIGTPGVFIWTLVLGSAVSGLLFGYEYVHCHPPPAACN